MKFTNMKPAKLLATSTALYRLQKPVSSEIKFYFSFNVKKIMHSAQPPRLKLLFVWLKNQPDKIHKTTSWGRDREKKNSNQKNQTNEPKPNHSNLYSKYRNL